MAPRTRDELLSYGVMDPAMTAVSPLTYRRLLSTLSPPTGLVLDRMVRGRDRIKLRG